MPKRNTSKKKRAPQVLSWRSVITRVAGTAAAIIGTGTALIAVVPRPSVTASDPADPRNPFSVSFTVANNGFVPLMHVNAILAVKNITYKGLVIRGYEDGKADDQFARFSVDTWSDRYLGMDDRFTVSTAETFFANSPDASAGRLETATIAIIVSYQPWILPKIFRREKEFRFKTFRQTNGQMYWFADAQS